jgi:hypothetical protein
MKNTLNRSKQFKVKRTLFEFVLDMKVYKNLNECMFYLHTEGQRKLSDTQVKAVSKVLNRIMLTNVRRRRIESTLDNKEMNKL